MGEQRKVTSADFGVSERTGKRGWRSGRPGSMHRSKSDKERDRVEEAAFKVGMATAYPWRVTTMVNGSWQFLCMDDDQWFHSGVPKPHPQSVTAEGWREQHRSLDYRGRNYLRFRQDQVITVARINALYPHWTTLTDTDDTESTM